MIASIQHFYHGVRTENPIGSISPLTIKSADRHISSPQLVKRQLGHSSIEVTFDVYGHLFPSSMENLVGGRDRLFQEAQTG